MPGIVLLKVILVIFRIRIFSSGKRKEREPIYKLKPYEASNFELSEEQIQLFSERLSPGYKSKFITCPKCGGRGKAYSTPEYDHEGRRFISSFLCPKCNGRGRIVREEPAQE